VLYNEVLPEFQRHRAFFVNGVRHEGPYDAASLLASIEYAAAEKTR
jgi:hypothetical protein